MIIRNPNGAPLRIPHLPDFKISGRETWVSSRFQSAQFKIKMLIEIAAKTSKLWAPWVVKDELLRNL